MNLIARLEIELAYNDFIAQHVNHNAPGNSPSIDSIVIDIAVYIPRNLLVRLYYINLMIYKVMESKNWFITQKNVKNKKHVNIRKQGKLNEKRCLSVFQ